MKRIIFRRPRIGQSTRLRYLAGRYPGVGPLPYAKAES